LTVFHRGDSTGGLIHCKKIDEASFGLERRWEPEEQLEEVLKVTRELIQSVFKEERA